MNLVLAVGEKIIAIAPIEDDRIYDMDYIKAKKRLLNILHRFSITALKEPPTFYLSAQSKMNNASEVR